LACGNKKLPQNQQNMMKKVWRVQNAPNATLPMTQAKVNNTGAHMVNRYYADMRTPGDLPEMPFPLKL
jgi:hypothetical protein